MRKINPIIDSLLLYIGQNKSLVEKIFIILDSFIRFSK